MLLQVDIVCYDFTPQTLKMSFTYSPDLITTSVTFTAGPDDLNTICLNLPVTGTGYTPHVGNVAWSGGKLGSST